MFHRTSLVIGKENSGRSSVIQNTVRYLLQHNYFGACFIIDCEDKQRRKKSILSQEEDEKELFIQRIYDILCDEIEIECDEEEQELFLNNDNISSKEFIQNLFNKLKNDKLFDSICFIILNLNTWSNINEIYEFIDIFNKETNEKCRCVLSSTESITDGLNDVEIATLNINELNKEHISQIFMSSITKNDNIENINMDNIMSHNNLHEIFNGSARITKRVAEFVNSESIHVQKIAANLNTSNHHNQLTLDEISLKYPKSAFAKNGNNQTYEPKQLLTVAIPPKNSLNDNDIPHHQLFNDPHVPPHVLNNHIWNESLDYEEDFNLYPKLTPIKPRIYRSNSKQHPHPQPQLHAGQAYSIEVSQLSPNFSNSTSNSSNSSNRSLKVYHMNPRKPVTQNTNHLSLMPLNNGDTDYWNVSRSVSPNQEIIAHSAHNNDYNVYYPEDMRPGSNAVTGNALAIMINSGDDNEEGVIFPADNDDDENDNPSSSINDTEIVPRGNSNKSVVANHGKSHSLSMQSVVSETTTNSDAATHGTSHTLTSKNFNMIQKHLSPPTHRKQNTYGIPDFGDGTGDSDEDAHIELNINGGEDDVEILHCGNEEAATILTSIPEATEEEYETENENEKDNEIDFDKLQGNTSNIERDKSQTKSHVHNSVPLMSDSMDSEDDNQDVNELYDSDNNIVMPPGLKPITPPHMSINPKSSINGHARNGSMVLTFDCTSHNADSEYAQSHRTYELLNTMIDVDSEDIDENAPFPDIAKLGRGRSTSIRQNKFHETRKSSGSGSKSVGNDPRFAVIVSDENHKVLPLTPPKKKQKQKKNSVILNGPPLTIPTAPVPRLQTSQSNTIHVYHSNGNISSMNHNKNASLNFNGLPTSSTKKLAAHQHSTTEMIQIQTRFDFWNNGNGNNHTGHIVKAVVTPPVSSGASRDMSFTQSTTKTPSPQATPDIYYYAYPEYAEYDSDYEHDGNGIKSKRNHRANTLTNVIIKHNHSNNHNHNNSNDSSQSPIPLHPLKLSPKNSDEPVAEIDLAKINDHNSNTPTNNNNNQFLKTVNTIHGYNSGSDDTLHYESSSNYDTPSPIVKLPHTKFTRSTSSSPLNTNTQQHHVTNLILDDILDHHHVLPSNNIPFNTTNNNNNNKYSPQHRMPITPKQRSTYDNFEGDGNVSEEDTNGLTDIINNSKRKHSVHGKQPSLVILFGRNPSGVSLSNMGDTPLKLLNQESQCEGQDYSENEEEDDQQPQPTQYYEHGNTNVNTSEYSHSNSNVMSIIDDNTDNTTTISMNTDDSTYVSLNVIAHLAKIKDTDARAIWMQACIDQMKDNEHYAYLYKLYPFLVKKFQVTTRTKNRYPQIQQLEHYFLRMGGKYLRNTSFPVIHITKYNKFYSWFTFMCSIVSELRMIYDDYNLDCLFYGKRTSMEILKMRPSGTFILSLTNKSNCLMLRYKKNNNKHHNHDNISTLILFRHSRDLYSVNKSKKKASLYQIIRPRSYLKYLYTPQMLIDKKALF